MINFESLVISVPANTLMNASFAESVFAASELRKLALPPDLRTALELILDNCPTGKLLRCVARPEIFTNGVSLGWLMNRIGGITDHISLSDGTSVKLIPGLCNHVFLYGLQSAERLANFTKLTRRAPELLPQFATQLNSFNRTIVGHEEIIPTPQIVMPTTPFPNKMPWFYAFYLNPHSIEDSVDHMLGWGEFEEERLVKFERVTYLPLSDISSKDSRFQKMLCESIATTYFDEKHCLLMRLPSPGTELSSRMRQGLESIRAVGLQLPRGRARNVFFLGDDLSEQSLLHLGSRLSFILHQSFEYWRYTTRLYAAAGKVTYHRSDDFHKVFTTELQFLTKAFGQPPIIPSLRDASDYLSLETRQ